eukprot:11104883-Alexandrium_andersonii.AAC.1
MSYASAIAHWCSCRHASFAQRTPAAHVVPRCCMHAALGTHSVFTAPRSRAKMIFGTLLLAPLFRADSD